MNTLLTFTTTHLVFCLSGLVTLIWYYNTRKYGPRKFLYFLFYPLVHFREVVTPTAHPAAFILTFTYLTFLSGVEHFLFPTNPYVYVIGWGVFLLFECCMILIYVLRPMKRLIWNLITFLPLIAISTGIYLSILKHNYQPLNILDFIVQVIMFAGAIYGLVDIFRIEVSSENVEAFFIMLGLIIYSFLHILSTSILIVDFVEYFDFPYYVELITLIYWIAIIPWIKRLKFKLSS